jgi:hypothetical protein
MKPTLMSPAFVDAEQVAPQSSSAFENCHSEEGGLAGVGALVLFSVGALFCVKGEVAPPAAPAALSRVFRSARATRGCPLTSPARPSQ